MKKNELRIGNLVKLNGEIVKVEQITKKKIGYHKEPRENVMHYARLLKIEPIDISNTAISIVNYVNRMFDINIKYVHQLQNCYYGLYNEELEVEL